MEVLPLINSTDTALFRRALEKSRRVGIVTHTRPDGDAAGSSLSLMRYILSLDSGPSDCRILLDSPLPESIRFILAEGEEERLMVCDGSPERVEDYLLGCDLVVVLDMAEPSRCGRLSEALSSSKAEKVLVDHHLHPAPGFFSLMFSSTEVSSTCELLCHVLLSMEGCLPAGCAYPLLTGITTDTNNFANSTSPATLRTAAFLMENGADRDDIVHRLYFCNPERRVRLFGRMLDKELTITDKGVAIMVLDAATAEEFGIAEGDTEGLVNIPLETERVKISIFIRESANEFRVSLRSKKGWSANKLAVKYFHGGGHELASGGKIPFTGKAPSRSEILALAIRYSNEYLENEA